LNTGRTAYRGTRRQFFAIEGTSVVVDEGDERAPQSLFTLSGLQAASTDASGRYFVAIDASGHVFGWKTGLDRPHSLRSLEGASAIWIPDHDSTRLPTVDLSFTGSIADAVQSVVGDCVTPRSRIAVGVPGDAHEYSCAGIRGAALRGDLDALLRRHPERVKIGDRLAELYALALGEPVDHQRRESIEWMAVVRPGGLCSRARSRSDVRRLVPRARDETPEHWTLVEALPLGAACPQRLDDLYAAVSAAGYPDAANAVRDRMRVLLAKVDATYP
jgi:hypothetical protein